MSSFSSASASRNAISLRSGMTPPANIAVWHARRKSTAWTGAAKLAGGALAALFVAQYLAGYFLLLSFKMDLHTASPLTTLRYLNYFGDNSIVRHRVYLCSALAVAVVAEQR